MLNSAGTSKLKFMYYSFYPQHSCWCLTCSGCFISVCYIAGNGLHGGGLCLTLSHFLSCSASAAFLLRSRSMKRAIPLRTYKSWRWFHFKLKRFPCHFTAKIWFSFSFLRCSFWGLPAVAVNLSLVMVLVISFFPPRIKYIVARVCVI